MEKSKNFILLKFEQEAIEMYKETALKINNQFLTFDKSNSAQKESELDENCNKSKTFKIPNYKNIKSDNSLKKLVSCSSQKCLDTNRLKRSMGNVISIKKARFNLSSNNYRNLYLTSTLHSKQKSSINQNSNISTKETNNMIDLIHKKEAQLCLDLIKKLPKNVVNAKNIDENQEENSEEANNLIKLIKKFNFDNINNQKRIEYEIIKSNENKEDNIIINSENSKILNSDIVNNPINNLSVSLSTNIKAKNILDNVNLYQDNKEVLNKNLNNSSLDIKNNNSSIIQNNSNQLNANLVKSASMNNIYKNKTIKGDNNFPLNNDNIAKNEINFHTGFVRTQKNMYSEALKSLRKKNFYKAKNVQRLKKDNGKLLLPEIEEFKTIINEIQNRKKKIQKKNQVINETKKDLNEIELKDKLIDELQDIYKAQKNTFLNYVQKNLDREEKEIKYDPIKVEINNNINVINKIKRKQNYFVDGYSLFGNKINKRLNDFNYILGNKFYDREQKKEKEEKFYKCIEEFENKLKKYRSELSKEHKFYKKIFKQKIDFKKDKKNMENYENNQVSFNKVFLYK